ncbi:hypothetical protein BaRGS_00009660 [Batillaria attramentaria]|uniref:Uncharacterized protein n=1 Tax=Batillaria attramentaria TaxID=370345 RepID=A0ABD0LJ32_9CAEN
MDTNDYNHGFHHSARPISVNTVIVYISQELSSARTISVNTVSIYIWSCHQQERSVSTGSLSTPGAVISKNNQRQHDHIHQEPSSARTISVNTIIYTRSVISKNNQRQHDHIHQEPSSARTISVNTIIYTRSRHHHFALMAVASFLFTMVCLLVSCRYFIYSVFVLKCRSPVAMVNVGDTLVFVETRPSA